MRVFVGASGAVPSTSTPAPALPKSVALTSPLGAVPTRLARTWTLSVGPVITMPCGFAETVLFSTSTLSPWTLRPTEPLPSGLVSALTPIRLPRTMALGPNICTPSVVLPATTLPGPKARSVGASPPLAGAPVAKPILFAIRLTPSTSVPKRLLVSVGRFARARDVHAVVGRAGDRVLVDRDVGGRLGSGRHRRRRRRWRWPRRSCRRSRCRRGCRRSSSGPSRR